MALFPLGPLPNTAPQTRRKKFNQNRMKNEETRIKKKKRRGSGTSRTTLNVPTSESWGARRTRRRARN